jgi:hypothetical protein
LNFVELRELMRAITAFRFRASSGRPKLGIQSDRNEGYVVFVDLDSANDEYLGFLEKAVKMRHLELQRFSDHLIIHSRE